MGLDNFPEPKPCAVLEEAGKLEVFRNERGNVDCVATGCPFTRFDKVLGCWIRGKIYDKYVWESCRRSLYEDKTREELAYILKSLNEYYRHNCALKKAKTNNNKSINVEFLIKYIETLLSIKEWDGILVAWF